MMNRTQSLFKSCGHNLSYIVDLLVKYMWRTNLSNICGGPTGQIYVRGPTCQIYVEDLLVKHNRPTGHNIEWT